MSFAVPFWVLWLQAAYSLWTFLRNAKFFRIPFITVSMLWHGYDRTWCSHRKYLLLDNESRETGGDWPDYDNEEEKKSHSFAIENDYDMRFKLNEKEYRFCASFETGKPLKFLHFAKNYQLVTEDIVLLGRYHLVRAVKPEAMLKYVLTGGTMKACEEYCIVDNTSSELLNANFMRILSILPLALQAKGFDQFSTLVSAILVIMDIFSYYFNCIWQACKAVTIKYTKLFLARLNVRYRVFIHQLLNTGSDSFMYCDDSMKKSYYKTVDKFMVLRGCEIPLDATTAPLSNDGDLPEREEIEMNLNKFLVETEVVAEGLYNITITDSNNHREKREFLSEEMAMQIINYLNYCAETRNYPFLHLSKNSVHVLNPIKAMIHVVFEWVLTVQLKRPVKLFVSDSTISRDSTGVKRSPFISSKLSWALQFVSAFTPDLNWLLLHIPSSSPLFGKGEGWIQRRLLPRVLQGNFWLPFLPISKMPKQFCLRRIRIGGHLQEEEYGLVDICSPILRSWSSFNKSRIKFYNSSKDQVYASYKICMSCFLEYVCS